MGPDAVVFVNHPPCMSKEGSHRPNFWSGNVILPRAAQWKDVMIAVHNIPGDDWMGFTHAYFPAHAFDEYVLREDANGYMWAFAKKNDGYLAITAAQCGVCHRRRSGSPRAALLWPAQRLAVPHGAGRARRRQSFGGSGRGSRHGDRGGCGHERHAEPARPIKKAGHTLHRTCRPRC